ncbi:hypothetical protein Bbelb_005560 [Branchiostoma belcheri]|nr:hypothetical protein Bbelb_005560 [Branchiostoma belcheri]
MTIECLQFGMDHRKVPHDMGNIHTARGRSVTVKTWKNVPVLTTESASTRRGQVGAIRTSVLQLPTNINGPADGTPEWEVSIRMPCNGHPVNTEEGEAFIWSVPTANAGACAA